MPGNSTDIHIFGTKEKELLFFQYMCHVIIRTIAPVSYEDTGSPIRCLQAVHHSTEGLEFIFEMNRLNDGVRISACIKIIESVEMERIEAFSRMALGNQIVVRGPLCGAEKGEGRTINSKGSVVRKRE